MLTYQYKGDVYETGQHYIEITDGLIAVNIHVGVIISKQEFSRFHAMVTSVFGEGIKTTDLCEEIKQYIVKLYRPYSISAIEVAKMNTFGSGYDSLALADYIETIVNKVKDDCCETLERKEQFHKYGIVNVNDNAFLYEEKPHSEANLYWFRSIYLTKVLGINEDQRKRHVMQELKSLGIIIEKVSGDFEFRLNIERHPYRGHIIDINYKETKRYKRKLMLMQERQIRSIELSRNLTLVKLHELNKKLHTLNV